MADVIVEMTARVYGPTIVTVQIHRRILALFDGTAHVPTVLGQRIGPSWGEESGGEMRGKTWRWVDQKEVAERIEREIRELAYALAEESAKTRIEFALDPEKGLVELSRTVTHEPLVAAVVKE